MFSTSNLDTTGLAPLRRGGSHNQQTVKNKQEKISQIWGMYSLLSGTAVIYDNRNKDFSEPVVIWRAKCSYKEMCAEVKKLQGILEWRNNH